MARTRWLFGLLAIGCALLMPLPAQAFSNGFLNSTSGNLYSMSPSDLPADNGWGGSWAFWNNSSYDGAGCNVGFVLTTNGTVGGGTHCASYPPQIDSVNGLNIDPTNLQFLGGGTKSTAAAFYFETPVSTPAPNTTFIFEKSAALDEVYWYDTADPSGATRTPIFGSGAQAGDTATITIPVGVKWGLEFVTDFGSGGTFLSDGTTFKQFALFLNTSTGKYYAGMEDINGTPGTGTCSPSPCSDYDFNDAVISFAPVPEPATMFLGGLGLIAFGYAARRRLFGR